MIFSIRHILLFYVFLYVIINMMLMMMISFPIESNGKVTIIKLQ